MSDHKQTDGYRPYTYDDPSANLWSTYLSKSEKYDKTMAQNWKNDMDAILIFAGLFSASVTTFIVESYKTLSPDPSNASVTLLAQISQQLAAGGLNSTLPGLESSTFQWDLSQFSQTNFTPPVSSIICNVLWFLSLGFSLTCALSATLVEQWTRQYLHASTIRPAPQDRARISAYLNQGIRKYKMAAIVDTIPLLLHISLLLFFAGLVAFLIPINAIIQYLILAVLISCFFLYLLVTALPIFDLSCPYWTPLSNRYWSVFRKLNFLHRRDADGNELPIPSHMSTARELEAIEITPERDQRDLKSMCWTLHALREDNEFEPFVEVIPDVVSGIDYSAKWLMDRLMHHDDISIKLGYRIPGLLATCTTRLVDSTVAQKRAITCLKAIWSLTMLSLPKTTAETGPLHQQLIFREDTFGLLTKIQSAIPSVENLVLSTSIVIARNLLDMYVERAEVLENHIMSILEVGQRPADVDNLFVPRADKENLFKNSKSRIYAAEEEIMTTHRLTESQPYAVMEALALHQTRLVALASVSKSAFQYGVDRDLLLDALDSIKSFQAVLSQAGLNLSLQYIQRILETDTLPHEAFNTLRRTFFRINSSIPYNRTVIHDAQIIINHSEKMKFTRDSQQRLVTYLEEAVEPTASGTIRLPHAIISILFNLTSIVVTHPILVLKAINIIENHTKANTNSSAPRALQILEHALPRGTRTSKPLDLFSSHLYTDTKSTGPSTKSISNVRSTTMDSITVTATIT